MWYNSSIWVHSSCFHYVTRSNLFSCAVRAQLQSEREFMARGWEVTELFRVTAGKMSLWTIYFPRSHTTLFFDFWWAFISIGLRFNLSYLQKKHYDVVLKCLLLWYFGSHIVESLGFDLYYVWQWHYSHWLFVSAFFKWYQQVAVTAFKVFVSWILLAWAGAFSRHQNLYLCQQ